MNAITKIPFPQNEPVLNYKEGSPEKAEIKKKIDELLNKKIEIPLLIGGKEIKTGDIGECILPHNHKKCIGTFHRAGGKEVNMAIEAALAAKSGWEKMPWEARCAIFLKAAELLAGPYRAEINAAGILNLSKTVFQAEIDGACELIDFLRFNAYYMQQIYQDQPISSKGVWNRVEYRPLEGFVFAVTPFNFISIGGNLPTAPAMVGNVVVWKPSSTAVYPAYILMKIFKEAGLPDGVINFVPGSGSKVGDPVLSSPHLAGIHFTGSTATFQHMWKTVGGNIAKYKSCPRIVGETGGKDFIFVHESADELEASTALSRGAFELQGQKCSAASRAYIPEEKWPEIKGILLRQIGQIKMGDPADFTNFMSAVIDKEAFDKIAGYIDYAKNSDDYEILTGGGYDNSKGYFIEPTIVITKDPKAKLMEEEIFGPVLTVYLYKSRDFEETLKLCDKTSPYGLTGAIFAKDREAVELAADVLCHAVGNFYINDKPTGAVVGQQPFGGARASGTNDKAGSYINLLRWVSVRTIKENFIPPKDFKYPFMEEA